MGMDLASEWRAHTTAASHTWLELLQQQLVAPGCTFGRLGKQFTNVYRAKKAHKQPNREVEPGATRALTAFKYKANISSIRGQYNFCQRESAPSFFGAAADQKSNMKYAADCRRDMGRKTIPEDTLHRTSPSWASKSSRCCLNSRQLSS